MDLLPSDRLEVNLGREILTYEVTSALEALRVTGRVVGATCDLVRVG